MAQQTLVLSVTEYADPQHWTWRLATSRGKLLGEHRVALDSSVPEYEAFADLDNYLRLHTAPDQRNVDERQMLERVGAWVGKELLGELGELIVKPQLPIAVRVVVPPEAAPLMYRPLELGHARGKPLAAHDVTFVFQLGRDTQPVKVQRIGKSLRILAVFSTPIKTSPLALRHERVLLQRSLDKLGAELAIDLRVLQYGVTIDALRKALAEGEGWDLVHVSGHGRAGVLLLETPEGAIEPVSAQRLVELLKVARSRLKCVTLSSCQSASEALSEARVWIGLEGVREDPAIERAELAASSPEERPVGIASAIIQNMDCAVLAMRYAVEDRFATEFANHVYEYAIGAGNLLPRAVQLGLAETANAAATRPIALATPVLFGRRAAGLSLKAPTATIRRRHRPAALPETSRFLVGRSAVMASASAALGERSGSAGVVLIGMAGIGKTACAVELADLQWALGRFSGFVWYKAPDAGRDIGGALGQFVQEWERQLVDDQSNLRLALTGFGSSDTGLFERTLYSLSSFLAAEPVLVVLDNLESLLREDGTWRDSRFGQLVATILSHAGRSRAILTSRIRPALPSAGTASRNVRASVFSLNALTLDESLLLARQMPNLERLFRQERYRGLLRQVMEVAQGHPKLLEMAERQAANPESLKAHLAIAQKARRRGTSKLSDFFVTGETELDADEFMDALSAWARAVASSMPAPEQRLFEFLCCLEETDRRVEVVENGWRMASRRLHLEGLDQDLSGLAKRLEQVGLIEIRTLEKRSEPTSVSSEEQVYYVHPAIAEIGAADTHPDVRSSVDRALARWWKSRYKESRESDTAGASRELVEAGLHATPYLLRLGLWGLAADILEEVRYRDESPEANERLLPPLRQIIAETSGKARYPRNLRILGSVLLNAGEFEEAERSLREAADLCEAAGNYKEASVALDVLIALLRRTGRPKDALVAQGAGVPVLQRMKACTKKAGLGQWSQFADEVWELSLAHDIGEDAKVLAAFEEMHDRMEATPKTMGSKQDPTEPWAIYEFLFDVVRQSALSLERWGAAIEYNEMAIQSQEEREAPTLEITQLKFNDCFPLIKMGALQRARELIVACRATFEQEKADQQIGEVFAALAALESAQQHADLAIQHESTALRYRYRHRDVEACSRGHLQLAGYLAETKGRNDAAGAHRAAGALIRYRTWAGEPGLLMTALRQASNVKKASPPLPLSFDALCTTVERTAGVTFRSLITSLPAYKTETLEGSFRNVIQLLGSEERAAGSGQSERRAE